MITDKFKTHRIWMYGVIVISLILSSVMLWKGFYLMLQKHDFDSHNIHIHQTEIKVFELATKVNAYLNLPAEHDEAHVNKHIQSLLNHEKNRHKKTYKLSDEIDQIQQLTLQVFAVNKLKSMHLDKIFNDLQQLDLLYDEKTLPATIIKDFDKTRLIYKQEIKLAKSMRELGLYLKRNKPEHLQQLDHFIGLFEKFIQEFSSISLTGPEKLWMERVSTLTGHKHQLIADLISLHQQKMSYATLFQQQVGQMNLLLEQAKVDIALEINEINRQIKYMGIAGLVLILFLLAVIALTIRTYVTAGRNIAQGIQKLLTQNESIAEDITLIKPQSSTPPIISPLTTHDEFDIVSESLYQMQQQLRDTTLSRKQMVNLLDHIGELRCVINEQNRLSHCSPALEDMGCLQTDTDNAVDSLGYPFSFSVCKQLIAYNLIDDMNWILKSDGQKRLVRLTAILLDLNRILVIGSAESDTDNSEPEHVFSKDANSLLFIDKNECILSASPNVNHLFKIKESLEKKSLHTLCEQNYCDQLMDSGFLQQLAKTGQGHEIVINRNRLQDKCYAQVKVYPLQHEEAVFALTLQDITQIRLSEERIHFLAYYDALTGLPNRSQLMNYLETSIHSAQRHKSQFAMLFLDLDGFKDINDTLGHHAGDLLLKTIGERIKKILRESDYAARLGGDEFCLITEQTGNSENAAYLAVRLLDAISQPYTFEQMIIKPRGSIGISLYPDDGTTALKLLQTADTAMYEAKQNGKHQYSFYTEEMTVITHKRMKLDEKLHVALEQRQFILYYQPQIDLKTGLMVGVEALIRWQHPKDGLILPDEFIPAAERLGLMDQIGRWVIETACLQSEKWRKAGLENLRMCINISANHFEQSSFVNDTLEILKKTGAHPDLVELEITESIARDIEMHTHICEELHRYGFKIAIDDFGTGYSSLSVLKSLRVNTLKIDKQFVADLLRDKKAALIMEGILAMAKGLGFETVVEGVESEQQVKLLYGLGCRIVQGFYFSKPVPAKDILLLTRQSLIPENFLTGHKNHDN